MNSFSKDKSVLKKAIPVFFITCALLVTVLLFILYLLLQSPSFPGYAERIINRYSPNPVEIGSVSFTRKHGLLIQDVVIRDKHKGNLFILIPSAEVRVSISGLLQKRIDMLRIRKPRVFINIAEADKRKVHNGGQPLPVMLSGAEIEDGEVIFLLKEEKTFHISAVDLNYHAADSRYAEILGSLFLDALNTRVPLKVVLDMEQLNLQQGHVSLTIEDMGSLPIHGYSLLQGKTLKGSAQIDIDLFEKEMPGFAVKGHVQKFSISGAGSTPLWLEDASGEVNAVFALSRDFQNLRFDAQGELRNPLWEVKTDHTWAVHGAYNRRDNRITIEKASLKSPLLGPVSIQGTISARAPEKKDIDLTLEADTVPIHKLQKVLNRYLPENLRHISGEGFAKVRGVITGSLNNPHIVSTMDGTYENIDVQRAAPVLPALFASRGITPQGKGEIHAKCTVTYSRLSGFHVTGETEVNFSGAGFLSADFTRVAENMNINAETAFTFSDNTNILSVDMNAKVSDFELLWGRFYGSFREKDVTLSLKGEYERAEDIFTAAHARIAIDDIGTAHITGTLRDLSREPSFGIDVNIRDLSNKNVYDFFIRDTFGERFPFLTGIEIGGTASSHVTVQGAGGMLHVRGVLEISDMSTMHKASDFFLQGVSLSLPVDLSYPEAPETGDTRSFGSLEIREISTRDLLIRDIRAAPSLWQNTLMFQDDIVLPLFGGNIRFEDVVYSDLLKPERTLILAVTLEDVDLEELSTTLILPRFSGSLSGRIPEARLAGGSLRTNGAITMNLFDGMVTIDNFSVLDVFGPVPSFSASAEVRDIDLGRLTETVEFGHISGVIGGYIRDIVIVKGQPERFEASIESIQTEGIDQWISVEALEKISILGSGSPSAVLSRGVYQLFKKYRYAKMGFQGKLRNDTLLLVGIETEGDKGYLVKGSPLPPRVDVISYTQYISFQELVKRLKRIKRIEREEKKIRPSNREPGRD
ncbi:hypothetical protein EP227_06675 [bacterium]|nr:MAG: hypothetical protein EP227_06675 [bacterium]